MEKEYYTMQVLHNQFVRSAITSLCKIFLWTAACAGLVGVIGGVAADASASIRASSLASSYSSSTSKTTDDGENAETPFVVGGVMITLIVLAYSVAVGYEVGIKIKKNKELVAIENERLGLNPTTTKVAANKKNTRASVPVASNNSVAKPDESDDDMI